MPSQSSNTGPLTTEQRVQLALDAIRKSGLQPNGNPVFSLRQAAIQHNVGLTMLTGRYNGVKTRTASHEHQQLLTPSQEIVLKAWIKLLALRGIPLSYTSVAEYTSLIVNKPVSTNWVSAFRMRHPDLVARWSSGLEACRARSLNRTQVKEFFDLVEDVVWRYKIEPYNIWNMDEKGVQMGVGKRTRVLVDRDQKTVYHLENGDRELVTVIEAVSAAGVALRPSVIFKGKKRNLAWARENPCDASISVSPNGWTDNDLGLKWLMYDFHPASKELTHTDNEWRLLILDGHNSHCTYPFVEFCEKHQIVVICLPAHTTHALQPCDVGVFGPLAASWKAEVNELSRKGIAITKYNFLEVYGRARGRVLTSANISSAFRKTGIFPFNPDAIPDSAFAPALNTTTQAAQPVPAALPPLLVPVPASPTPSACPSTAGSEAEHSRAAYTLLTFPSPIKGSSSRAAYIAENKRLRAYAEKAKAQMAADYASRKLMDAENARLRTELFGKQKAPRKRKGGSGARHMTGQEMIMALARADCKARMAEVFAEAATKFKEIKLAIQNHKKEEEQARLRAQRVEQAALKAKEKAETEAQKAEEAAAKKREKDETRRINKEEKKRKADEKKREQDEKRRVAEEKRNHIAAEKKEKADARKAAAEAKKLAVEKKRAATAAKKAAAAARRSKPTGCHAPAKVDPLVENSEETHLTTHSTSSFTPSSAPHTTIPSTVETLDANLEVDVLDDRPSRPKARPILPPKQDIPGARGDAQAVLAAMTVEEVDQMFVVKRRSTRATARKVC